MARFNGAFLAFISARRRRRIALLLLTPDSWCRFSAQRSSLSEVTARARGDRRLFWCRGPLWNLETYQRQKEWLVFSWIFLILTINALIFDYRDIVGDRLSGTKTIPAWLGHRRTRGLLMLLSAVLVFVSVALSWLRLAGPSCRQL